MVAERLGKYIDFKGISFYAFENSLGVSRGSISKAVKENKSIGSNVLENILIKYDDMSPAWLLTGKGEMIKSAIQPIASSMLLPSKEDVEEVDDVIKVLRELLTTKDQLIDERGELLKAKDQLIEEKDKRMHLLEERVQILKRDR